MALTDDQQTSIKKIKEIFAQFNDTKTKADDTIERFDTDLMRKARVIDATSAGTAVIEVDLSKAYSNRRGTLHGGAAALILDQFTTAAFIPNASFEALRNKSSPVGGATRSINISCLRALPLPATVRVEAKVIQLGRRMNFVRGSITSKDGDKTYFTGEQHKMNISGSSGLLTDVGTGKTKL